MTPGTLFPLVRLDDAFATLGEPQNFINWQHHFAITKEWPGWNRVNNNWRYVICQQLKLKIPEVKTLWLLSGLNYFLPNALYWIAWLSQGKLGLDPSAGSWVRSRDSPSVQPQFSLSRFLNRDTHAVWQSFFIYLLTVNNLSTTDSTLA